MDKFVDNKINTSDKITILIPAYNEELSIGKTVETMKSLYPDYEILVVDDGSTDSTMNVAMQAGANVWPHPYNIGNGAAVKTGLRCASSEWIVLIDADGQHDPKDIARLVEHKDKYDMVVGARSRESTTTFHRRFANRIFNWLATYITKFKIEDLTSGFRLIRKSTVEQYLYLLPNTFSYPTTMTMAYLRSGLTVKYVPIKARKRKGISKIRLFRDGVRFFLIIAKIATLFSPLRIFLPISFLFFASGSLYYLYTFIDSHRFSNMSALLLSTSVIIFMMGLISEQISQMRYDRVQ
ncbi:MAG: glycosyltransferase family 2 protein [Proteobacteria bacterium]|nr:glycosyltransferase family 2 protein [Pseudomonadota bacterium]MBU1711276.1 glycosyltransferase family 2 protein [Pseudomonadota bacterium]